MKGEGLLPFELLGNGIRGLFHRFVGSWALAPGMQLPKGHLTWHLSSLTPRPECIPGASVGSVGTSFEPSTGWSPLL